MLKLNVGVDISKTGVISNINRVISYGGNVVQFYMGPRSGWNKGNPLNPGDIKKINELRATHRLMPFIHSKLLINLCHTAGKIADESVACLAHDLIAGSELGADVIVHQGKNVTELKLTHSGAISAYVSNIKKVLDMTHGLKNRILMENSCQQGKELGFTIEDLAHIWSQFDDSYKARLGFCIDLCHIHVAGTMNVSDAGSVKTVLDLFHKLIGLEHIRLIHYNDSNIAFNKHNDCHEDLLVGHIGNPLLGGSSCGFKQIVRSAMEYGIPLLLETPGDRIPYADQVKLVLSWADGGAIDAPSAYEIEYIKKHKKAIDEFSKNPVSRKGNKKQCGNTDTATTATPVAATDTTVTSVVKPLGVIVTPKTSIAPAPTLVNIVTLAPRKKLILLKKKPLV
jgi:deoxyribonuclease-4